MTTVTTEYSALVDKRAMITKRGDEPFEGTIIRASAMGVLVKPKGSSTPTLILAADVEDITEIESKPSTLRQKALDAIADGKARRHLLDYHGISLSQVNEITEEQAVEQHNRLPHEDAGHHHNGRKNSADGAAADSEIDVEADTGTEDTDGE